MFGIANGMNKGHLKAGRARANASRSKAHALLRHPIDRLGEMVHPQTNVIQRRFVNLVAKPYVNVEENGKT